MAYITGDELRDELQSGAVSSLALNALYDECAAAACTAVDEHCFRNFDVPDDESVRTYRPTSCYTEVDELDDIANTTNLAVAVDTSDSGSFTALAASAWYAETDNTTGMVTAIRSTGTFPSSTLRRRTIRVTARYGWPATPGPVRRAAMIWAIRLVNRRITPTGIVGFGEFGGVKLSTIDPDVKALLAPYRRTARLLR